MAERFLLTSLEKHLLDEGILSPQELREVQSRAIDRGVSVEEELLTTSNVPEMEIIKFNSKKLNVPYVELDEAEPSPEIVLLVPQEFAQQHFVFPFAIDGGWLHLAMAEPKDTAVIDQVRVLTGRNIKPFIAARGAIEKKIFEYLFHYRKKVIDDLLTSVGGSQDKLSRKLGIEIGSIADIQTQSEIVRTINALILQALQYRASDIHIEPTSEDVRVRFRIDGVLQELAPPLRLDIAGNLVSRVKVMCELDITEHRLPQDGHFRIFLEGQEIDFRVVVTPTIAGEKAVLRVLDRGQVILDMKYLGFEHDFIERFRYYIGRPHGIIIMTGPTGSGKTTTLYSALKILNRKEKNITTVENPIEYRMEDITQIQVHPEIGLTFAHSLRSILRQDPDIILIGEIRDLETTEIAIRASLTGHLVFATLHTNDAPGAITRLLDMGAEPFLIASTLRCIVSQRLVRKTCKHCKVDFTPEADYLREVGAIIPADDLNTSYGKGCMHCFNTGYSGRTAIGELLEVNDDIRALITEKAHTARIRDAAIANGMIPLRQDGLSKVFRGVTTFEEVIGQTEEL
jgi:type II secretory ATPase GspE/PulE/Tfp pilus assembly ATPase PilB-like protein